MAYPHNIREEELKNLIARDWFSAYDTAHILGDIDFSVAMPTEDANAETEFLLWAEAKKGSKPVEESFAQLILTIGKAKTYESHLPPKFIGAFDADRIVFIPYSDIQEIFYKNDFNWNITPSDHSTKEFHEALELVKTIFAKSMYSFDYENGKKDLARFIKSNFVQGKNKISRIRISKNNFVVIYQKWLKIVKPTIDVAWDAAKKEGVLDSDFYLADLLSKENDSILDKLQVLLKKTHYVLGRKKNGLGLFTSSQAEFNDAQKAHRQFWNKYERPPKKEYWNYIIDRKDLLVPQDIRERQGSYFTPQKWVELSQEYLASELGEDWQDEYYIWDCAAGTGNLLNGLSNKYHIWASTLNQADVDVMKARIDNGANLLPEHVFQFDFLNDSFDKLPDSLQEILNNSERQKKLVLYINPPYAEGDNRDGEGRSGVAINNIQSRYGHEMGYSKREIYIQFFMRIIKELPHALLASFSKLKHFQSPKIAKEVNRFFQPRIGRSFIVPADTFDNVSGDFPIGFFIYYLVDKVPFAHTVTDVYSSNGEFVRKKEIVSYNDIKLINGWAEGFKDKGVECTKGCAASLATIIGVANDFQNQRTVRIENPWKPWNHQFQWQITINNLIESVVYLCARTIIKADWQNDKDQFLAPFSNWIRDNEFQTDCLAYALFNNLIQSSKGVNHWIPFTESEVNAKDCFKSHFMTDFIHGKKRPMKDATLFSGILQNNEPFKFSSSAIAVFDAGRELWRYYHSQEDSNPDASLYDIKLYFQGTKTMKSGKIQMKPDSDDRQYTALLKNLRDAMKILVQHIEPKIYQYGFLK